MRTAISRRRTFARASSRLATFVQAISSTSPTAANSTPRNAEIGPRTIGSTREASSGSTLTTRGSPRPVGPVVGEARMEPPRDDPELGLGLLDARAAAQAADQQPAAIAARLERSPVSA